MSCRVVSAPDEPSAAAPGVDEGVQPEQAPRMTPTDARVLAVASNPAHALSKTPRSEIRLLANLGVEGDAHAGVTVQHRSRVAKDPSQPNLRQVHLLHAELLDTLCEAGFEVEPGTLGENVTTRSLDLLALPRGTRLHLGDEACVELTGLRNPCQQLEAFQPGLLAATLGRDAAGNLIRKAGVMGVVIDGGVVRAGDRVRVELPQGPSLPLERV